MTRADSGSPVLALLCRPAVVLFTVFWVVTTLWIAETTLRLHAAWLFALACPVPTGLLLGQIAQEVQHTTFAWTLPNVRRRFGVPLVAAGAVAAAVVVMAVHEATRIGVDGVLADVPIAAVAFFGFSVGLSIVRGLAQGFVGTIAGVTVFMRAGQVVRFDAIPSLAIAAFALVCAALMFHVSLSVTAFRRPSLPAPWLRIVPTSPGRAAGWGVSPLSRTRVWTRPLAQANAIVWARAAIYARHGFRRLGWFGPLAGGVTLSMVMVYVESRRPGGASWQEIAGASRHLLMNPSGPRWHFGLACTAIWIAFPGMQGPPAAFSGLLPTTLYPLSRAERARAMFASHLLTVATCGLMSLIAFGGVAWLAGRIVGPSSAPAGLPGFVAPVVFLLSVLPFLLWRSIRAELATRQRSPAEWALGSAAIVVALIAGGAVVSALSSVFLSSVSPVLGALLGLGILALSQLQYWRMLAHIHRRGDLI